MFKLASVLIPSYNRLPELKRCLAALKNQNCWDFEVIVIDDGSKDSTSAYLSAYHWPRLRWERLSENQGRSAARNRAIAMAQAPLLIFLDSDVIVNPEFVGAHLHFHQERGPGWIGQGKVIITHDQENPTATPFSPWTDASRAFFATGNVSVARQAVLEVGGFDLDFRHYGWEDLELGIRLRQHGLKSAQVSEAIGYHLEPPFDLKDWPALIAKEQARGRGAWLFFQKHSTLEVRLITQLTPLHRGLDWLLQLGGQHNEAKRLAWLNTLKQRGYPKIALALARAYLNHYQLQALESARKK
jgi:GT2 family glycosyltransferase